MRTFVVVFLCALSCLGSPADRVKAHLVGLGLDEGDWHGRFVFYDEKIVVWSVPGVAKPAMDDLPDEAAAQATLAAWRAGKEAARQSGKAAALKRAENRLMAFLVAEGVLPAGSTGAAGADLPAMFEAWEAAPGGSGEAKLAKYVRLLEAVRACGGSGTLDAAVHPEE